MHFVAFPGGARAESAFAAARHRLARETGTSPVECEVAGLRVAHVGASYPGWFQNRNLLVVGNLRIDNRDEVAARIAQERGVCIVNTDPALVASCYAAFGADGFSLLAGDFGFVLWDVAAQRLYAVRDWLGIERLFTCESGAAYAVASDAKLLAEREEFDSGYVADFIASTAPPDPSHTIWRGVRGVEPGFVSSWHDGTTTSRSHSVLWDVRPDDTVRGEEVIATFTKLFEDAVAAAAGTGQDAWSQLSGGQDSSSIVVTAHALASRGRPVRLAGTYSYVDDSSRYGEEHFVDAVVALTGVRNHRFRNFYAWQDDECPPPCTDEPRLHYVFWTRDRAARRFVQASGGNIVIAGDGSDHYLGGNPRRIADLLLRGRVGLAMAEAYQRSRAGTGGMWFQLASKGIVPAARALWWRGSPPSKPFVVAPWMTESFRREIMDRSANRRDTVRPGLGIQGSRIRAILHSIRSILEVQPFSEAVEKRYPFLSKALVRFCLSLPMYAEAGHGESKWMLRESMRGRLPESVRARNRKTSAESRMLWALDYKRDRIDELLRDPLVSQAGWVERKKFCEAVAQARAGIPAGLRAVLGVLSLETWLSVTSGRWKHEPAVTAITLHKESA